MARSPEEITLGAFKKTLREHDEDLSANIAAAQEFDDAAAQHWQKARALLRRRFPRVLPDPEFEIVSRRDLVESVDTQDFDPDEELATPRTDSDVQQDHPMNKPKPGDRPC